MKKHVSILFIVLLAVSAFGLGGCSDEDRNEAKDTGKESILRMEEQLGSIGKKMDELGRDFSKGLLNARDASREDYRDAMDAMEKKIAAARERLSEMEMDKALDGAREEMRQTLSSLQDRYDKIAKKLSEQQ